MFEYSYLKSLDSKRLKETSLKFPASAFGSKEMKDGIKNDSVEINGLGDPNVPESFSVWAYDRSGSKLEVKSKIKTGVLVGEMEDEIAAVGGSSPNSIVASDDYVFVSNVINTIISLFVVL